MTYNHRFFKSEDVFVAWLGSVGEALSFDTAAGVSQGYCTPRANEAFDMDLL